MSNDLNKILGDVWGAKQEDLQTKQSGVFGLNTGHLVKLAFNDKAGKDGADANAIDMEVNIKDRVYNNRFFLAEKVGYGDDMVGPGEEGYVAKFVDTYSQIGAVVKHALKSVGVTDAQIESIERTPVTSEAELVKGFTEDAKKLMALLPAEFQKKQIDVFLEWQWQITGDNDRKFLILPKNMKGGYFLSAHVEPVGKWEEVVTNDGLHYVDNAGNKHPLTKTKAFMDSPRAKEKDEEQNGNTQAPSAQAQKSAWD